MSAAAGGSGPGRRRWPGWAALALLLLGLWWLWRGDETPPVAAPPPAAPDLGGPPPEPPAPFEADPELPEAVRRYLARTVYPPSSGRLTPEDGDLLEPNRRHERPRPIPDTLGDDPAALVHYELSADRYDVTGAERVEVWLEAKRGGEPLALRVVEARVQREGRAGAEGEPLAVAFRPAGRRLLADLPLDALADHHGSFLLEVRFAYGPGPGQVHEDSLRFFQTPEDRVPARFTGRFHDYVREGSLRLEIGLDVERGGFYRLDANFYDAAGAPAAFASFKGELESGERMVPLEVFGRVLRDAGASGPFEVGQLRGYRFADGHYPDRETIPAAPGRWVTGPYALHEFSGAVWDDEHKRHMVDLMLEDEEAGIGVDVPQVAGQQPPVRRRGSADTRSEGPATGRGLKAAGSEP